MTDEEIGAVLLYFRNNGQRRNELILWILCVCALRPGELFALRWTDWDPVLPKYSNAPMGRGLLRWSWKPNISSVARLLAFVTGLVNQELLLNNEYLLVENRILKAHLQPGLRLSRPERTALAEIGKQLGRKLLQQVASDANPDTILGWYRQLVAAKFDGSRQRRLPGRPRIAAEIEHLVVSADAREFRLGLRPDRGSVSQSGA
jgi:hypothetical protein